MSNVYTCDTIGKLKYQTKLDCKNRQGKFSLGCKVSGINFINNKEVLISTNDSRLRLFNLEECLLKVKFKGHLSENLQL